MAQAQDKTPSAPRPEEETRRPQTSGGSANEPKPGDPHRGAAAGGGKLVGPDAFGGYDDDMGRGAD